MQNWDLRPRAAILSKVSSHPSEVSTLAERLLAVMDQKNHWAYAALSRGGLSREQLLVHFRHEYLVYIRDFPVLLARALGQVPPIPDVRRSLAENLYEEQTGALSKSAPHPELFLRMMRGLGFSPDAFAEDNRGLAPSALAYRALLREGSSRAPWQAAVALLTIFVEGSVNERAELRGEHVRPAADEAVRRHPLVAHYACPIEAMALTRAHAEVEGNHRRDAWRIVLEHSSDAAIADVVVATTKDAFEAWWAYRDGVAALMGLGTPG